MNTPDTEVEIEQNAETGEVLTANGVNLTPDTEWEDYPTEISMKVTGIILNKERGWSITLQNELKEYKNAIIASRDTYWKERVKERDDYWYAVVEDLGKSIR